jgi:hypothetical protein
LMYFLLPLELAKGHFLICEKNEGILCHKV